MAEAQKKEIKAFVEKTSDGKLVAIASTETKDRMGDVIKASGWKLNNYKKNPVLLFAHKYNEPPIGIAKNIRIEENKLVFEPVFHGITQLSREIKEMYTSEPPIMRAFSVGFIPLKTAENNPHIIEQAELLEISAVPVPANAEALVSLAKSYSPEEEMKVKSWLEKETKTLDDVIEKPYPNEHACRLQDPSKYDRFARKNCFVKHNGKCIDFIFGIKGNKTELQSMRYPKDVWSEAEARSHCKSKGGTFEPASEKTLDEEVETKGVIPYSVHGDGPKAPIDTPWNAAAELKKASGNAARLKKMHTWIDTSDEKFDPSERKWYKLPHHKGDGTQPVVWRGVAAAMAALFGARGGVDIPDSDRKGVYNHLAKHYKQFDKEPPEFREYNENELKEIFGEVIEKTEAEKELEELKKEITSLKTGRVLSEKNKKLIQDTISVLKEAVSMLRELLRASEPPVEGGGRPKGRGVVAQKPTKNDRALVRALQKIAGITSKTLSETKKKND